MGRGGAKRHNAACPVAALGVLMAALVLMLLTPVAVQAQDLEPRAYVNTPVGFNFFIASYAYSAGGLSTEPSLPVQDAQLEIHTSVFAYARSLDLWGKSGKFDVILPYSQLSGTASVAGQPAERHVSGFGDPRFRFSVNLYGAPALSMQQFAAYRQDLVIGASLQVSVPSGQYDPSRALNLGANRWSVKPDIGFSKPFGAFTLDFTTGVTFSGKNDDYFGGKTLEQDPIYSAQTNLSYNFGGGVWAALGATYYYGGRTTVNDVRNDDLLNNSRAGAILVLPVNRHHSIKFNASTGVSTRTGSSFNTIAIAWQYRWGEGF